VGTVLHFSGDIESVRRHADLLQQEATKMFGAWSPEYINTMTSLMGAGIEHRATDESAVYFAQAAAAQLRMRGRDHWETRNALNMAWYTIGRVDAASPGAAKAADAVILALKEFPQGVTTPAVIAECLLAKIDVAAGQSKSAMERLDRVELSMRAPQAPKLSPHAWARLQTVRGECLKAMGRLEEAKAAFDEAVATTPQFQRPDEAEEWTREARACRERM
jgi:tetratricopeptide (TPR) repeat protein